MKLEGFTITVLDESEILRIDEIKNIQDIKLYPNPSKGLVNIKFTALDNRTVTLEVLDPMGRKLVSKVSKTKVGENKVSINLSDKKQGIYWIRALHKNGANNFKVLITK